ncbi:MAG: XRE family transcriptional regulator [Rhodospirillales bacterium]|nr:XRE family transcriptional regulator [Rhodospirillales bacterium]
MATTTHGTDLEFALVPPARPGGALSDAGVHSRLIVAIGSVMSQRSMSTEEAARLCGISATQLSALLHGQTRAESMDQLVRWLTLLGRDVEIIIRRAPPSRSQGRMIVLEPM